ncbi:hypothetical protein SODALDRAFT_354606 [Sodiomyces alkalinus F11]|uniref:Uncharacterized protein n=1 Tax=Sodiomyces alkalinus (strain CBS 110278 / VKM F-3762 / F11) TaxID=1314773 RepID=A0A3N2Q6R1_SODAK|nr:hypothetical protein SODALDRAFT_354606 [Sodiomyces alkalinus F11]ROT42454.1 hypothetical protein SODALDRAFT_354606 [Sodiomyces alkalinus F11]
MGSWESEENSSLNAGQVDGGGPILYFALQNRPAKYGHGGAIPFTVGLLWTPPKEPLARALVPWRLWLWASSVECLPLCIQLASVYFPGRLIFRPDLPEGDTHSISPTKEGFTKGEEEHSGPGYQELDNRTMLGLLDICPYARDQRLENDASQAAAAANPPRTRALILRKGQCVGPIDPQMRGFFSP